MKISTEPSDIYSVKTPARPRETATAAPRQIQQMDNQFIEAVISRLSMDRSMGDALSMASMSSSLMQKALEVSSRLRDLAMKTAAESRPAADIEVIDEISVMADGVRSAAAATSSPELKTLPDITAELSVMREQSELASSGAGVDLAVITETQQSLTIKAEKTADIEAVITGVPAPRTALQSNGGETAATAAMIGAQPAAALTAQGNILGESAAALLS